MEDVKKPVTLATRLLTYHNCLKQMDVLTAELTKDGFVTIADRDKWEKLLFPERARVAAALVTLGEDPRFHLPKLPEKTE